MVDRADINAVDDAAWEQAVAREAVIRRLACKASPNRAEFLKACRDLGLKRSRLYELISAYKARPVASSLLAAQVGTPTGKERLDADSLGDNLVLPLVSMTQTARRRRKPLQQRVGV